MRIFRNFVEAYHEVEREIKHNGLLYQTQTVQDKNVDDTDEFITKELIGYSFLVKKPNVDEFIQYLNLNTDWIKQEFIERTDGKRANPGEAYKLREVWNEFLHNGYFSYTYGGRIAQQVNDVIKLFKKVPFSRHGLINIYDKCVDNEWDRRLGKKRVPCSMYYMLFNREVNSIRSDTQKQLETHMIYNIRSNDFSSHFPYDLVLARLLQEYIAHELGTESGDFIYQSGSLHCFKKDNKEIF